MAIAFEDSRRALEQQLSTKLDIVHLVLLGFLSTLVLWAFFGDINLYRTSISGSLKTQSGAVTLQSAVDATIKSTHMQLGMKVEQGQLLLELDNTQAQLSVAKLTNELQANQQQQQILLQQQQLTRQKYQLLSTSLENEIQQTRTQLEQAQKVLETQLDIQKSITQLANRSAVAKMDLLRQDLEVVRAESQVKVHQISLDNKIQQIPRNEREQALALNQIDSQLATLKDHNDQLNKALGQAEFEAQQYALHATAVGEIVQLIPLPIGNKVVKGQKLATISDGSEWMLQTRFKTADAAGHIAKGQPARVLVDGFPWRQYGALAATVTNVAKEGSNDGVEVQLQLQANPNSQIPLTFGQPVTVEIKTETLTPLMLLLNASDRAIRSGS